jgi:hypothetical protein
LLRAAELVKQNFAAVGGCYFVNFEGVFSASAEGVEHVA